MLYPHTLRLPRRLLLTIVAALLAATGTASAQTCGTGGCAFWATEVNDSWFNPFRWGGILPWQGGVPNQSVTCRIELPVQVDVLGQGQVASCHHLQFNHVGAVVRVAGSSFRSELNVHGTQMDNNALILIGGQDALQDSSLIIHNNTNANGANGRIRLSAPLNHGAFLSPISNLGWVLVNWPSHTIEGNGTIRVSLQNDGLVDANVSGRTLSFDGGHSVDNHNLVRARDGGLIVLSMPNGDHGFRQFGLGRIVIENGSGLALIGAGDQGLRGGRLQTIGSGVVTVFAQGFPIEDVHFESGSRLTFSGNAGLYIGPQGLQNDGLIHTGPSGFVTSRLGDSTTLTGSGRLQLEGGTLSALFGGGGQAMVNAPGHTIGGFGTIALALTNQGELLADRNGLGSGPVNLQMQTSAMANEGLIEARNGGSLTIFGTTLDQTLLGTLGAAASSSVVLSSSTVRGGVLSTGGNGVIVMDGSASRLENLAIAPGGNVLVPCFRELDLVGGIDNDGHITVDNAGCGPNFAIVRGVGNVLIEGSGSVRLAASSEFGNAARLIAEGGLLTLGPAQSLSGYGRLSGNLRVEGAIAPDQPFAPAGAAGALTLDAGAQLSLVNTSALLIDILDPASFDRIVGNGNIVLDGTLFLDFPTGFETNGELVIDIVTGSAVSGQFDRVVLPPGLRCGRAAVEVLADRARLTVDVPMFCDGFETAP